MTVRAAIIGPTGYTGLYLVKTLLGHSDVSITGLASRRDPLPNMVEQFPELLGRIPDDIAVCRPIDARAIARDADVAFTCLPQVIAMQIVPSLIDAGLRVIDLSADYRLDDPAVYESVYQHEHSDTANLSNARYGLPELFRDGLCGATLVANPGCYPTAVALAVAPVMARGLVALDGIIINAATGVSGAGRKIKLESHFPEQNESYYAYGTIGAHRHQPEIIQTLSRVAGKEVDLLFVPHLLPIDRGILATIYLDPARDDVTQEGLFEVLEDAYDGEPFVRVRNDLPNVKQVRDTNFCDVTVRLVKTGRGPKIVLFSAIDNMIKGASGQAVQNMNLLFGLEETTGLM